MDERFTTFVTGATGFLGSSVARALVARGHRVSALARRETPRGVLDGVPIAFTPGDLTDPASLALGLAGCDAVIHCAADYRIFVPDPGPMFAVNVAGTEAVMRAAMAAGVRRIVHVSSVATLKPRADGSPATEAARPIETAHTTTKSCARLRAGAGHATKITRKPSRPIHATGPQPRTHTWSPCWSHRAKAGPWRVHAGSLLHLRHRPCRGSRQRRPLHVRHAAHVGPLKIWPLRLHAAHVRPLHLWHLRPRLHLGHLRAGLHLGPLHLRLGSCLHLGPRHRCGRPRHRRGGTGHRRCRPRHGRTCAASGSAATPLRPQCGPRNRDDRGNSHHYHAGRGKHPAHSSQPFDETVFDETVMSSLAEDL